MNDKDLKIRLIFEGQDKLSGKFRNLFDASKRLKGQMGETLSIQRALQGALARSEAFEKQTTAVAEYTAKLADANTKLAARKAALAAVDKPNQKMIQGVLAAERLVVKAAASLKREETALANVTGEMTRAGMATDNLAQQQAELKARIDKTKASYDNLASSQKRFGKMRQFEIAAGQRGNAAVMGGGMQLAATAAAAAPLYQAAMQAAQFQSNMVDLRQTANLTAKDTAGLASTITRAAADTAQPLANVQAALQSLVAMGLDPRIGANMLKPIGQLSTTYKAEALDVAKASFAAYSNLKVPISQTAQALETMAFLGKAGKVELADMARVLPSLTGSAQTLGMTGVGALAQLGAALQVAGNTATDADEAANNVNNLLNKLGDNETLKKFRDFGIDAKAAYAAGSKAGVTQLETMIGLLGRVQAKGGTVNDIFGDMQARAAAAALLANKAQFKQLATSAAGSRGMVATDAATRLQDDPLVKRQALINRLQLASITLGDAALPAMTALAEGATWLLEKFTALATAFPKTTGALASLALGFAGLSTIIGVARIGYGLYNLSAARAVMTTRVLTSALAFMSPAFAAAGTAMAAMRARLVAATVSMLFAAPAAWAAMAPFLATGLAIAGMAALAYHVYKHWDGIVATFEWAKAKLSGYWADFQAAGGHIIDGLLAGITAKWTALKNTVSNLGKTIAGTFKATLGINSPSRLFAEYGGHLMTGLANGINGGAGGPVQRINRLSRDMTAALAVGAAVAGPAGAGGLPAAGAGSGGGGAAPMQVTINIAQQPGQSAPDLARLVAAELDKRQREAAAARRSAFRDYGG